MQGTSSQQVVDWINELAKISSASGCDSPGFIKPFHLVTMGLAIKAAGWAEFCLPENLQQYASRMHLWDSLNMEPPIEIPERSARGRFLPVQRFNDDEKEVEQVARDLAEIVIKTADQEYQESISICLTELVNNFFDHSKSDSIHLPCLVAAQSWPKGELVQIAIADAGIGIRESLSENQDLLDDLEDNNACFLASNYGVTSKPHGAHSGYGLNIARELMHKANGNFVLGSGDELFVSAGGNESTIKLDNPWYGTLLVLEWKMTTALNVSDVYNSWPTPEGFDEDDFF